MPYSEIPGSKLARSSPRLIAASHVLHRRFPPRHPPYALHNFKSKLSHFGLVTVKKLFPLSRLPLARSSLLGSLPHSVKTFSKSRLRILVSQLKNEIAFVFNNFYCFQNIAFVFNNFYCFQNFVLPVFLTPAQQLLSQPPRYLSTQAKGCQEGERKLTIRN